MALTFHCSNNLLLGTQKLFEFENIFIMIRTILSQLVRKLHKKSWLKWKSNMAKPGSTPVTIQFTDSSFTMRPRILRWIWGQNKPKKVYNHSNYRQNNNLKKCAGMVLKGFIPKKLNKNYFIKEKKNILGAV